MYVGILWQAFFFFTYVTLVLKHVTMCLLIMCVVEVSRATCWSSSPCDIASNCCITMPQLLVLYFKVSFLLGNLCLYRTYVPFQGSQLVTPVWLILHRRTVQCILGHEEQKSVVCFVLAVARGWTF